MPPTYIAGYDGSDASRAAVRFAATLGKPRDAHVIAAHVYPTVAVGHPYLAPPDVVLQTERAAAERLLSELDDDHVEKQVVPHDSPAHGLQVLAESQAAELIAVGMTHHRALGRLVPGSVGMHLLSGAPFPVVVVPAETADRVPATIGIAYDHRPEARHALAFAERMAADLDARLLIVGAHEPIVVTALEAAVLTEIDMEAQEVLQQELEQAAASVEREAEIRLVVGPPGNAIAEVTPEIDLLVTGSRGYGPVRSVLLGSVSRHLVDHAACPVLVTPRAGESEDEE